MDWARYFQLSLSDLLGLVSRRTVILLVMAIFIYQGVGIFYKALALQLIRMRPAPAVEIKAQAAAVAAREPADAYLVIPERNLFGTTTNTVTDKQTPAAPQQDIALLFDVRGTVAGEGKYGFAVIEEKGTRKQRLVKAGDVVAAAKVIRIKRNAVDFLVEGQERTLKMAEMKEAPILPPAQAMTASTGPPPQAGTFVLNRSELQEAMADMGSMLSQAQIRPYFNAGVPDGFIVTSIRPGSLYQKMGIVNGDIIQEVDNRKIRTADDVSGLLNTLKSSSDISMVVKRGGNPKTMNYQFR
ncbi:MAG: PDZ domain-containing protein [Proteobacteria bacterium]|nr:PDZ domain-containing protein [Pseudomonadota bacterium]MBU1743936.1 PDZ domain-containing protein [Pseudomonadota bacterium]